MGLIFKYNMNELLMNELQEFNSLLYREKINKLLPDLRVKHLTGKDLEHIWYPYGK